MRVYFPHSHSFFIDQIAFFLPFMCRNYIFFVPFTLGEVTFARKNEEKQDFSLYFPHLFVTLSPKIDY